MFKIFLPFIRRFTVQLGTYIENLDVNKMQYAVSGQHIAWGVKWSEVEAVRGIHDWSLYDPQYESIGDYPHRITVKMTPEWARIDERKEFACSPPKREYWENFVWFIVEVLHRYRPSAIEIWNEPDVDPTIMIKSHTDFYGGWGGMSREYAEFVEYIYNYLKPVWFPSITIMGGALMLDGEDQWQFATDLIEYGKFDVLSFHAYPGFCAENYDVPLEKADRLTQIYKDLGKKRPPFWLSETSYRTPDLCDGFYEQQAQYLKHLFYNASKHNIRLISWYTLANNNWDHTDLVSSKYSTIDPRKPVYYEFKSKFR